MFSCSEKEKMSNCWFEKKYWFDYNIINLLNIDKNDFSNKNYNTEQSINLNNYFAFDYFYIFVSV